MHKRGTLAGVQRIRLDAAVIIPGDNRKLQEIE